METSELWEDQRCGPQPLSYSLLSPEPWPPHWPDVHLVGQCISFWTQARVISGLWPQAVNWASLSAEDEVDMVNDGQDSEEKISLPSCYGGIGRQGEAKGGVGPPCLDPRESLCEQWLLLFLPAVFRRCSHFQLAAPLLVYPTSVQDGLTSSHMVRDLAKPQAILWLETLQFPASVMSAGL